jgi:thioredoxin-dependent peroxiredoxin
MAKLRVGDPAPPFKVDSSEGSPIALDDYRGKWLVLYFYPKAFTSGCTKQTIGFQNKYAAIDKLGAAVLGVSNDPLPTQCSFSKKYDVTFPLLADTEKTMSNAYGVVRPLVPLSRRMTFVIDPEQKIRAIFHYEMFVDRHIDDVVEFLKTAERAKPKKGRKAG